MCNIIPGSNQNFKLWPNPYAQGSGSSLRRPAPPPKPINLKLIAELKAAHAQLQRQAESLETKPMPWNYRDLILS